MRNQPHVKLYIPGPIEVAPETFEAMSHPMIGHRGSEFSALYEQVMPVMRELMGTARPVFLSTSSAWGVMEAAIRNLSSKRVLNCCCGAFSDKWHDVTLRCGRKAERLAVEWGQPILPEDLRRALEGGDYDLVTLVHNETSTGVLNPLADLAAVVRDFPGVMLVVDTVSSFSAVPIEMDALGIDVVLTGSQKALALPPGLAPFAVSERALERAANTPDRGYYFDFLEFEKNAANFATPSTPCISLIFGLAHQLQRIAEEGIENRYKRHAALNAMIHQWGSQRKFEHFAAEGYRSKSLTTFRNNLNLDLGAWNKILRDKYQIAINMGYGKIKGKTFRISNMGDETAESIDQLIHILDQSLADLGTL